VKARPRRPLTRIFPSWIGSKLASRQLARNTSRALSLNRRHEGEDVFIVGSGPQLNTLTPEHLRRFAARVTIGANRVHYRVPLKYFLSAYPAEVYLAMLAGGDAQIIHARPVYEPPILAGLTTVRRTRYRPGTDLSEQLSAPVPTLHTRRNVALMATHLSIVMGARRIIYVGVEQESALHYYDTDEQLRHRMREDLASMPDKDICALDHPYATIDEILESLRRDPKQLTEQPFYAQSHIPTFQDYFSNLERLGIDYIATTSGSVVARAGAKVIPLDDVLSDA
jgi:hypothetical protein